MGNTVFMSAIEAVKLIKDDSLIGSGGFVGIGVPEEILCEIENKFIKTGSPKNIGLIYSAGQGDGKEKGLNHLGHEGLISKIIGGHWGLTPKLGKLANENKLQGYNLPQGVISHMFRDLAAGKPGTLTHVGLGTFVDPDIEGGKINNTTTEDIVHKMKIKGKEYLFYDAPKIDFALLRGTAADENGNISFEKEALTIDSLSIAMAAKNNGGTVIVQVEKKIKAGTINPHLVKIPGILVDAVVVVKDEKNHMQSFAEQFNPLYVTAGDRIVDENKKIDFPLTERKVIARRCAMLLNPKLKTLNYGIGMPEGVAQVLAEEKQEHYFTPTVEPGAIGGTPAGGLSFGCSTLPEAIIDQPYQFDFYDGGGLDMAFLGLAQCDSDGNVNVSKFGPKIAGCGGFINITQNAKEVIFCGTFRAGGLKTEIDNGELKILQEGKFSKFLPKVEQITFSGNLARKQNKEIVYITERAVFKLTSRGLTLTEIAPGIDLENDILDQMDFKPIISKDLKIMDPKIFKDELIGLDFS